MINEILENPDLNFIEKSLFAAWHAGYNIKDWIQNQTTRAKYRKALKQKVGIDIYYPRQQL